MIDFLPPALIMLLGALLVGPARGAWRTAVVLLTPLVTLAAVWQVPDGVVTVYGCISIWDRGHPVSGERPRRQSSGTLHLPLAFASRKEL